jgi:hypothetical protein
MCYCDLVKLSCSHRVWSDIRQPCDDTEAGRECQGRRIRRHVYLGTNDICLHCQRNKNPSTIDPYRASLYDSAASCLTAPNMILRTHIPTPGVISAGKDSIPKPLPCRHFSHDQYNNSYPYSLGPRIWFLSDKRRH